MCVTVCAVRLESFDVNKLCHCFVRPLSPKQHIISLLQGLSFLSVCFLCVSLCYMCVYTYLCLFVCMWCCMQYVWTVWECDLHHNFPISVQCSAKLKVTDCLCKAGSLWRNWSLHRACVSFSISLSLSSFVSIIHFLSRSLIHLNLSHSLILSFTHSCFFWLGLCWGSSSPCSCQVASQRQNYPSTPTPPHSLTVQQ